jgi:hypothetical protein
MRVLILVVFYAPQLPLQGPALIFVLIFNVVSPYQPALPLPAFTPLLIRRRVVWLWLCELNPPDLTLVLIFIVVSPLPGGNAGIGPCVAV